MKRSILSLVLSLSLSTGQCLAADSACEFRRSAVESHVMACFSGQNFDMIGHIDRYHGFMAAQEGADACV